MPFVKNVSILIVILEEKKILKIFFINIQTEKLKQLFNERAKIPEPNDAESDQCHDKDGSTSTEGNYFSYLIKTIRS